METFQLTSRHSAVKTKCQRPFRLVSFLSLGIASLPQRHPHSCICAEERVLSSLEGFDGKINILNPEK